MCDFKRHLLSFITVSVIVFLGGCTTVDIQASFEETSNQIAGLSDVELILKRSPEDNEQADAIVAELLKEPLNQSQAIKVVVANSPAFQALLAKNWVDMSNAAQSGRIPNPTFSFERIVLGADVEIGRFLSFGVLDLLTLPLRQRMASSRLEVAKINLTNTVIEQILTVRQAWVEAIAGEQSLHYAQQVFESAEASATLAQRMEAIGNFSALDRARQQSFYSNAAAQLIAAQHNRTAKREYLIRQLGLNEQQLKLLKLPDRLPELPDEPLSPQQVSKVASQQRLDVQMAQAALKAAHNAESVGMLASYTDIEFGRRHDTHIAPSTDGGGHHATTVSGEHFNTDGYEIDITLPLFDWGDQKRNAMGAQTLVSANRLAATLQEARSSLREAYSAYRASFDLARLYKAEIIPIQELMAEETVLRYNGMLIGVFELLSESRRQIETVQGAINANEQYWLADAALQASIIGKPSVSTLMSVSDGSGGRGDLR
jgi:outer membrane protein TolC